MSDPKEILNDVADHVNNLDKPTAEEIENRYWKQTLGTTDLAARGYRSYWD